MKKILKLLIVALIPVFGCNSAQTIRMYVGTYTNQNVPNGFHIIDFDFKDGTFTTVSEADAGPNPSYLCISKKRGIVYAANEASREVDGVRMGSVTALKLNADGSKAEKVKELFLLAGGPVYVSLTPEEDFLLLAHYGSGAISVARLDGNGLPVEVTDTAFFRTPEGRGARGHMAATSPDGKKVYLVCLSIDKVMIFDLNKTTGKLTQTGYGSVPAGDGPRHFAFGKDGSKMYVINELGSTMTVFDVGSNGSLREIQTISTLPEGWTEPSFCADVHLSKDGQYLYGSNRGHNSIVTYKVAADGKLSVVGFTSCGGNWPRNFTLDPSGKYMVVGNQNARPNPERDAGTIPENITLFEIDKKTGLPILPGKTYGIRQPACIKFM